MVSDLTAETPEWPQTSLGPLTAGELSQVESAVARLRDELSRVVTRVALEHRTIHGLAKLLGVDRNLTQRLLSGLSPGHDEIAALSKLPGVRGMGTLLGAFERSYGVAALQPARSALEAYARVISLLGGSRAALRGRLAKTRGRGSVGATEARTHTGGGRPRLAHLDAARELAGYGVDLQYGVSGVAPSAAHAGFWRHASVTALVGVRSAREHLTLTLSRAMLGTRAGEVMQGTTTEPLASRLRGLGPADDQGEAAAAGPASSVIEGFCSGAIPRSTWRAAGDAELECLDLDGPVGPVTVVTGSARDRIDTTPSGTGVVWSQAVRVRHPTGELVFDHYVHRALEPRWRARASVFWWTPMLTGHPEADWPERVRADVTVERHAQETGEIAVDGWTRAAELTRATLRAMGWSREEMVRYRVRVRDPFWGTMAYLTFVEGEEPG